MLINGKPKTRKGRRLAVDVTALGCNGVEGKTAISKLKLLLVGRKGSARQQARDHANLRSRAERGRFNRT